MALRQLLQLRLLRLQTPAAVATGKQLEDFILPDIGEGIVECEIVEWLIKEGDVLAEDQPVCDVMTDKALVQIPAKYAGKVVKLHYAKGEIAKVHSPLFQQEIAGTSTSAPAVAATPVAAPVCAAKAACAAASTCSSSRQWQSLSQPSSASFSP